MSHHHQSIGLIGIGLLGTALAERLLQAGYSIVGFDTSAARCGALSSLGGHAVESAASVTVSARKIVLSLPDSEVVESVVAEILAHCPAGTLIIDTTTGDPDRTSALAERLSDSGIEYVDATIA